MPVHFAGGDVLAASVHDRQATLSTRRRLTRRDMILRALAPLVAPQRRRDPMDTSPGVHKMDALDHPLYRIAHLHGSEWVTLRPEEQHTGHHEDLPAGWDGATVYRCEGCDERVVVASA
jgi:hypothetical protein